LLLAYEKFGYDLNVPGRIPELLPYLSVRRLVEMGAQAIKILLHYTPFEDPRINDVKHAWVERIGAECAANDAPFFLEFIGYDETGAPMNTVEYARRKPEIVTRSMEEFSKPQYGVDVLKVEFPVNLQFVAGTRAYREGGTPAYSRAEAREAFQRAASVTGLPFIYLSAGVCDSEFVESLELAADAATEFSGVLCGRATWQDGVPLYVRQGAAALEEWLGREGVRNIQAVNAALRAAKPWWSRPAAQSGPGAA
jgi:tagatose 1,6-diphosphate aldolase